MDHIRRGSGNPPQSGLYESQNMFQCGGGPCPDTCLGSFCLRNFRRGSGSRPTTPPRRRMEEGRSRRGTREPHRTFSRPSVAPLLRKGSAERGEMLWYKKLLDTFTDVQSVVSVLQSRRSTAGAGTLTHRGTPVRLEHKGYPSKRPTVPLPVEG